MMTLLRDRQDSIDATKFKILENTPLERNDHSSLVSRCFWKRRASLINVGAKAVRTIETKLK